MEGQKRIIIESVTPVVDCGRFPIKRIVGELVTVEADVFCDGHDEVAAQLLYRREEEERWREKNMQRLDNDRWRASFIPETPGIYRYTIRGWVDHFRTWQKDLTSKYRAGAKVGTELQIGIMLLEKAAKEAHGEDGEKIGTAAWALRREKDVQKAVAQATNPELGRLVSLYGGKALADTYPQELSVHVDREKALFSTWYELFPRSCSREPVRHGTLKDVAEQLPEVAAMGFDVLYLPPIHPVGKTHRRGRHNSPEAKSDDPGSPWAIGSSDGGHKAIHPELGTLADFRALVQEAADFGIELALDIAFQCSPDHPYLQEHPEWFLWRPDGTVQFAENPPKKYPDIVPFNFETPQWRELWEELKSVIFYWMDQGVSIFRVDNPHTKPFAFWEWLIAESKRRSPEVIFLAEAFTRPKVMSRLARLGFTQSYSYFTWRTTKEELTGYLTELTRSQLREFMRPNFWPNTPDILPEYLQYGGKSAFMVRLVLAATLSSNYGIYGPAFELCVSEGEEGKEEYHDAEKYRIYQWDRDAPGNLRSFIAQVNRIRREHPALRRTANLTFCQTDNDAIIFYAKSTRDRTSVILVAVNLDPFHSQKGRIRIPIGEFGIEPGRYYPVQDLLSGEKFIWQGEWNDIELDHRASCARIFQLRAIPHTEADFEYYL